MFEQFVHSQPSPHFLFFPLQPQRCVWQPVLHPHPLSRPATLSITSLIFVSLYHTIPPSFSHPHSVSSLGFKVFLSAWLQTSNTQHDLFQCRCSASVLGTISFSNWTLSHIVCLILCSHSVCCCNGVSPSL